MKVDFDGMRLNMVANYNSLVRLLNAHITDDELQMDRSELEMMQDRVHDLKMTIVTLAYLSGENETFGEIGNNDTKFLNIVLKGDEGE